jgi:tetratricopeptide (TPR) repeat protein
MKLLELIAERTGKPLAYFLAPDQVLSARGANREDVENGIARLELALQRGELERVITDGGTLVETTRDLDYEPRVRILLADAWVRKGDSREALAAIEPAVKNLQETENHLALAEALDVKASALYVRQAPDTLAVAERALAECEAAIPGSESVAARILGHLGAIYYERHDWKKAVKAYERAVEVGGSLQHPARIATMYEGLGLAYQELGNPSEALRYSHKAIALHARLEDELSLANAENNLGWLLLRQGQLDRAEPYLHSSLERYEKAGVEHKRSHVLLSLAELQLERGDLVGSVELARAGINLATKTGEAANAGYGNELLARAAEASGDSKGADRAFEAAIKLLEQAEAPERLIESHSNYARALEARGDAARAVGHWKAALAISRPTAQPDDLLREGAAQTG